MKKIIYLILSVALVIAIVLGAIWDFRDTVLYLIPAIIPIILLGLAFLKYKKRKNRMNEEERQIFKTVNKKFKVFKNFATCLIVASIILLLYCIIVFDVAAYEKALPEPDMLGEFGTVSLNLPLKDEVGAISGTCYTVILLILFIVYYVFIISIKNRKDLMQTEKDVLLKCYRGMGAYIIISFIVLLVISNMLTIVFAPYAPPL